MEEPLQGSSHQAEAKNSIGQTALLVVANCAGAGILSLPKAINGAGLWTGTGLVVAAAMLSAYTADILGRCYHMIETNENDIAQQKRIEWLHEDLRNHKNSEHIYKKLAEGSMDYEGLRSFLGLRPCEDLDTPAESFLTRSPYAAIGQKAVGKIGAVAVTVAQVSTQFSVMVLFFLISGLNLATLIPEHSSLFWSLICCGSLTPLMLLRPGHVWGTAVFAILASVILVVVIVVLCATDAPHKPHTPMPLVTFPSLGTSFGVILFGFGGHAILPALQATMLDPTPARYRQAIIWSFLICTVMYLCTSISSVLILGGTLTSDSDGGDVLTLFTGWVNDFGLISVTAHLLFAAVTVHIPLGQILDHYTGASDFSPKQICIRIGTMGVVAAVIWLVGTHFFCVISLVGGTCNNAMIFIFPPWFYIRLVSPEERTPLLVAKMVTIMIIGTAGMVSALVGAVDSC